MKKLVSGTIIVLSVILGFTFIPSFAFAADTSVSEVLKKDFQTTLLRAGVITTPPSGAGNIIDLDKAVGNTLQTIIGFVGSVILVLMVYAGAIWTTAQGNQEKVAKAKKIMLGSIIGLVIVITSTYFLGLVFDAFSAISQEAAPPVEDSSGGAGSSSESGS